MKGDVRITLKEYLKRLKPEVFKANKKQIGLMCRGVKDFNKRFVITQSSDLLPS